MKKRAIKAILPKGAAHTFLAASTFPTCPDFILKPAKKVRPLLEKAEFDECGLRVIRAQDCSTSEWDFSIILPGSKARFAAEYEYLRECQIVYDYKKTALAKLETQEEWIAGRKALARRWPDVQRLRYHPAWNHFPIPFVDLPETLRQRMRKDWPLPIVQEMDREDFAHEEQWLALNPPAAAAKLYTVHRLMIRWEGHGIGDVEDDLLRWFRSIRSPALR